MPAKMFFNIGTGVVTKFDDLIALAKRLLPKLEVEIIPGKTSRSLKQPLVLSRAKELLGWEPQFTMETGFKDYIEDLKVNA